MNAHLPVPRTRFIDGPVAGLAAAFAGLGVAEIIATLSRGFQSPVIDVADRVVDGVPQSVKALAISWFGTNDKIALLYGIGVLLAIYAMLLGVVTLSRRWRLGLVGAALFGAAGAYASQSTRRGAPVSAVIPSVIGALVAGGVLIALRRIYRRGAIAPPIAALDHAELRSEPAADTTASTSAAATTSTTSAAWQRTDRKVRSTSVNRRQFLLSAGATLVIAGAVGGTGRRINGRSTAAASRSTLTVPRAKAPLAAVPTSISSNVPGQSPFFTPNADFYRIDTAITVPQVTVDDWRLKISGLVDTPIELTFAELTSRELVEADITLTCVSNEVGGTLMGTARWLGVRLDDLLAEAGVSPVADQIVGRSVDGYTCGFPTAALDGRDALVAIAMNGELLPVEHGFPARLIVPGLYGYVSATKWLTGIEVTRFDAFDQYWVERGWVSDAPIKVSSRIDTPRGLSSVDSGTVAIAGVAWAQTRGIERVELSIDEGEWVEATLADELNDVTWRQWSYAWQATSGRHSIAVRATEKNGAIQTAERAEPFPSGATGQHQIIVLVR